jgi:hypothetical protein
MRHMAADAQKRALALVPGEKLGVSLELTNPVVAAAIQLTTSDYSFIGWTPRYLVADFLEAICKTTAVTASVVRVNADDVPANRRVLVEFRGIVPKGTQLMASDEFQPLVPPPTSH